MQPIKRKFIPQFPDKYKGNVNNIIARSSWEYAFLHFLDQADSIKYYASEEIEIPYLLLTDKKIHRYYPDIVLELISGERFIVEIKPFHQRIYKQSKKVNFTTQETFIKNQCKWQAAREVARNNGMNFIILDEYDLKRIGVKIALNKKQVPKEKLLYEHANEFGRSVETLIKPLLRNQK